jgi:hypothetical protein
MYLHRYREGLTKEESEVVRKLRLKGYAIVVLKAGAMQRGAVEEAMRKAAKRKEVQHDCTD